MPNTFVLCFPLLASIALAQTTHVVSGGGNALQTAINAASPGDILDVLPGSYSAVTVTRGMRISLRAGASIVVPFSPPSWAISIVALPAGEAFVLEGGTVNGFLATACAGAVVLDDCVNDWQLGAAASRIDACSGPVAFHRVRTTWQFPFDAIEIVNSAAVSFCSCRLQRLVVTNSSVSLAAVEIPIANGSVPGLHVVSGSATIAGGTITGGLLYSFPFPQPGILIDQGALVVTGGTSVAPTPPSATSVSAIQANGGTVQLDPSVQLLSTPTISGPGSVTFAPIPSLAVARTRGSANYTVSPTAQPNDLVFTLIGLPAPVLPLPWGDAWIDPLSPILDVTVAPTSRTWSFTRSLAGAPAFLGLVVQSAALSPNGTIGISPPVRFVWD